MTITRFTKLLSGLVLLGLAANANALSVSLVPADISAAPGDTISLDVVVDFTGDPTLGGGFDISFDSSLLSYVSYDASVCDAGCDVGFGRAPDVSDGLLTGIAFGNFNGVTAGTVGTLTFDVNPARAGDIATAIGIGVNAGPLPGGFVSAATFGPQDVDFFGANVNISGGAAVPLPAAVWLMMGGLGALFGFGRKNA